VLLVLALTATLFASDTDTTFTVQRGQRLELSTHAGDIVVHTWARNAVRVQASGSSRFHVAIDQTASLVSIHSAGGRSGPPNLDYQLTVPTWMAIRLSGVTAGMRVDGVQGPVNAETVEGDVVVVGGGGLVSLRSVEGDVSLTDAKGKIDVNSVNSDVNVRNVSGEVQAETVNGDVNLIQVQSDNVEANTVNGDVNYDGTIRADGASWEALRLHHRERKRQDRARVVRWDDPAGPTGWSSCAGTGRGKGEASGPRRIGCRPTGRPHAAI
jgi:DUF4097 and DUF4098 domain-containing protein YvlB